MICASLLDAGADSAQLREKLSLLDVPGYSLEINKINKQGFSSTKFDVILDPSEEKPHRHLHHITDIINNSKLDDSVKKTSIEIFTKLAEAEARVHGSTIEKVHFHEVGAVDAIVDICSAVILFDMLNIDAIHCSKLTVGSGTVKCDHGIMPVPAPATAELIRNVPFKSGPEEAELLTPTAAAILTTLSKSFGELPDFSIESIGYGAGTRDNTHLPNVLRVMISSNNMQNDFQDSITVLETNLDDISPEITGHTLNLLLDAGALDAFVQPIQMKKFRPGFILTVLCENEKVDDLETIIFRETSTFGIRKTSASRSKLKRTHETVTTPAGKVRMKIGVNESGRIMTASPEFSDCEKLAVESGLPLKEIMSMAEQAWLKAGK